MAKEIQIDQFKNTLIDNGKFLAELFNGFIDVNNSDDLKNLLNENMEIRLSHIAELLELKVKNTDFKLALQTAKNSSANVEEFAKKFTELRAEMDKKSVNVQNMPEYIEAKDIVESINKETNILDTKDDNVEIMNTENEIFLSYNLDQSCHCAIL